MQGVKEAIVTVQNVGAPAVGCSRPEVADGHGNHPSARGQTVQLKNIRKTLPLRVLSPSDWRHWVRNGYVVVREAVPRELLEPVIEMLWEFQEMNPNDPSTWAKPQFRDHKMKELNGAGMVEVYNHQSLWETRQNPRVYDAFVDIWDREDLWVAHDRANLLPPNKQAQEKGWTNGFIHFDIDVSQRPLPIAVQGVLSLTRQGGELGGFQAVPGIFHEIEPPGSSPFKPDTTGREIVNVPLNPGDLLIFNSQLAHGVRPNVSLGHVRMAQYISMFPADFDNAPLRQERIRIWAQQAHPIGDPFPGDPREFERKNYPVAKLGPLGRKLLGLDPWF
jgi:ectoine hydroxylase-related dioxygenase (phytanoyl-CoA dioxygenase family)